jgi:putative peptidoglycan lipid II flippase
VTDIAPPPPRNRRRARQEARRADLVVDDLFGPDPGQSVHGLRAGPGGLVPDGGQRHPAADAYNAALAFPNLFRRFFAEGAFAAAFVPAYAKSLQRDGEETADILAADAMATLAAATIIITIACQLAMPWLMMLISPGFGWGTEKYKLAVLLTQITMPYLPCMAIVAHLSGVLNARDRFILSAGAPILLNICTLASSCRRPRPSTRPVGLVGAIVVAGVAQAALLTWGVNKSGAKVHWRLPRLTPEKTRADRQGHPRRPGGQRHPGQHLHLRQPGQPCARRPDLAGHRRPPLPAAAGPGGRGHRRGPAAAPVARRPGRDGDDAQSRDGPGVTLAMALTLPAAAALVAMPGFLSTASIRGRVHRLRRQPDGRGAVLLRPGHPGLRAAAALFAGFFARGDTKSPMRFALISVAVNVVLGIALFNLIGVRGIAAATAVASWLNVGQMAFTLSRKAALQPSATWSRVARILAASVAMGLLLAPPRTSRPDRGAALAIGLSARDRGQGVRPAADLPGRRGALSAAALPVRRG